MTPVSTAVREPRGAGKAPALSFTVFTPVEELLVPLREIVVDWQMPSDTERKG